jgi:predicted SprT family Zn-dependent metalloprotease
MLEDTVPHEIAHFVCQVKGLGKNHDEGWRKVCRELGGNGITCYKPKPEKPVIPIIPIIQEVMKKDDEDDIPLSIIKKKIEDKKEEKQKIKCECGRSLSCKSALNRHLKSQIHKKLMENKK